MKIRFGFVSNSSSMSFIVVFPIEIKTNEDIKNIIFKNISDRYSITDEGDNKVNIDDIVGELLKQIQDQTPNDEEKAIDRLNGYIILPKDVGVNWSKYNLEIFRDRSLTLQEAQEVFKKFKKEEKYFYTFTFENTDFVYQALAKHLLFIELDHLHIINH